MAENGDFEKRYFDLLDGQLKDIKRHQEDNRVYLEGRLDDIDRKLVWVYAFAAGVGAAASFAFQYLKQKWL